MQSVIVCHVASHHGAQEQRAAGPGGRPLRAELNRNSAEVDRMDVRVVLHRRGPRVLPFQEHHSQGLQARTCQYSNESVLRI